MLVFTRKLKNLGICLIYSFFSFLTFLILVLYQKLSFLKNLAENLIMWNFILFSIIFIFFLVLLCVFFSNYKHLFHRVKDLLYRLILVNANLYLFQIYKLYHHFLSLNLKVYWDIFSLIRAICSANSTIVGLNLDPRNTSFTVPRLFPHISEITFLSRIRIFFPRSLSSG